MTARQPRNQQRTCPTCGYTTPVTTRGIAETWLRRHSCDQQRERDRKAAAVAARRAADGPRRDCICPVARHEHGTRLAYVLDRCRCRACRDATAADQTRVDKLKAYGQFDPFTEPGPVLEHIRDLQAAGMGLRRIGVLAGVSQGGLTKLVYGKRQPDGTLKPTRRVRKETAARLLAVRADVDVLADNQVTDPTGARRRLRALVAHGWSITLLADRMGMTASNFSRVVKSDDAMHATTVRKARDLYDEIWDVSPPAHDARARTNALRARRMAERNGWLPALAWDDSEIDDPSAWADLGSDDDGDLVDEIAVEEFIASRLPWQQLTKTERIAAALLMQDRGYSRNQIHAHCHINQQELTAALNAARHAA